MRRRRRRRRTRRGPLGVARMLRRLEGDKTRRERKKIGIRKERKEKRKIEWELLYRRRKRMREKIWRIIRKEEK